MALVARLVLKACKVIQVRPDLLALRDPTALTALLVLKARKAIQVRPDLLALRDPTALMALLVLKARKVIQVRPDLSAPWGRADLLEGPARLDPRGRKARLDRKAPQEQAEMKTGGTATPLRKVC
jgi:hypothetical protein